jgi:hypothetical protein
MRLRGILEGVFEHSVQNYPSPPNAGHFSRSCVTSGRPRRAVSQYGRAVWNIRATAPQAFHRGVRGRKRDHSFDGLQTSPLRFLFVTDNRRPVGGRKRDTRSSVDAVDAAGGRGRICAQLFAIHPSSVSDKPKWEILAACIDSKDVALES